MPKKRIEQASNAISNPPHPGDPTSHVSSDRGEPLHKPPQEGAWRDDDGVWHAAEERDENVTVTDEAGEHPEGGAAAVPSATGRDHWHGGATGPATDNDADGWRDDPMPEGAQERLDWAQRGTDTDARINAAIRAEEARGSRKRTTVISGLEALRREHRENG